MSFIDWLINDILIMKEKIIKIIMMDILDMFIGVPIKETVHQLWITNTNIKDT